jgi:phosphonate transport system substrate-binding protein
MFSQKMPLLVSIVILLAIMACGSTVDNSPAVPADEAMPAEAEAEAEVKAIVLGDISDDPGEVIEGTQPLADYLAARLGDHGVTEGRVTIAADADEMIKLLKDGEVDLYFDSVYPATLVSDASGGQPILRRWRFGVEEYYTVIFASTESGITSLDDLPGHKIALDNPFSTSGYLLPAVYMTEQGLNLVGKEDYDQPVADDEVGFVFSYDDENTLQWVLSGLVDAGATDDWNFEVAFPEEVREKLVVLTHTESVPRQVVVARPGIDPDYLNAIKELLISMHEDEDGQAALESFQTSQFDEFPEGIEAAQDRMRDMMVIAQGIPLP